MSIFNSLLLLVISLLAYAYWFFKKAHRYFDEHGIPYNKPRTFLGNMADVILLRKSIAVAHKELYKALAPYKFAGFYTMHRPAVMVRDPELIKMVMTKDFAHFQNRGFEVYKEIEPLSNHLFAMKGEEWKNLRIKLTSTFTTGKMKMMFPLIKECGEKFDNVLGDMASNTDEFEIKDICSRFTTDVIGSCAFGVETHSLENPDSEFRRMGKRIFEFRYQTIIRGLFPNLPSKIVKYFNMQFIPQALNEYFVSIVRNMVNYREKNNVSRFDFLDLLIALKNNTELGKFRDHCHEDEDLQKFLEQIGDKHIKSDVDMTVELMAAQCFLFFAAGFETSSSTLSFMLLELAHNKQIQSKVREEIKSVIQKHDGSLSYESLKEMTYTDMVLSETLRKYPPAGFIIRTCGQNYKIPNSDVVIKEGTQVIIPVYGLHFDKQYYERPEEFYPEHFTEETKAQRHHYTYLPFGEGPRVCIAERFAKMQVKIGLVSILQKHEFELAPRMKMPVEFVNNFGLLTVKGGIWVKCKKIE